MIQHGFPIMMMAAGLMAATPAHAQATGDSQGQIIRLSPEQIARLRETGTEATAAAATSGLPGGGADRQIHGELGIGIGTNGARGIFGTAAVPLGPNAGAVISFEDSRFGHR